VQREKRNKRRGGRTKLRKEEESVRGGLRKIEPKKEEKGKKRGRGGRVHRVSHDRKRTRDFMGKMQTLRKCPQGKKKGESEEFAQQTEGGSVEGIG